MATYYNEIEPYCVEWLVNLGKDDQIPLGDVDARDIRHITASDLAGYDQCHFFAGIGGWPYALKLAEWPADRPVWTGSCPCQPYSAAGKQKGNADERNLWPVWFDLIRQCKPPAVFGEQVASAIRFGWLDRVFADLEGEGYACAAAVLPACSVNAPHLRYRLFYIADAGGAISLGEPKLARRPPPVVGSEIDTGDQSKPGCGATGSLALAACEQVGRARQPRKCASDGLEHATSDGRVEGRPEPSERSLEPRRLGSPNLPRSQRHRRSAQCASECAPWAASEFIYCRDAKWRRIPLEPRFQPLADGLPGRRVGVLRGAGNAIVPQVAAEFIRAFLECK